MSETLHAFSFQPFATSCGGRLHNFLPAAWPCQKPKATDTCKPQMFEMHRDQPYFSREFKLIDVMYVYAVCSIHPIRSSEGFKSSLFTAVSNTPMAQKLLVEFKTPMFRLCLIKSQLSWRISELHSWCVLLQSFQCFHTNQIAKVHGDAGNRGNEAKHLWHKNLPLLCGWKWTYSYGSLQSWAIG